MVNRIVCDNCTERISHHKLRISCSLCSKIFHPKCEGLTPTNIAHLGSINALQSWFCHDYNMGIFPCLHTTDLQARSNCKAKLPVVAGSDYDRKREHCATCNKIGNSVHLVTCELCDLRSHKVNTV